MTHDDDAGHGGAELRADFPSHAHGKHTAMLWAWLMLNGRVALDEKEDLRLRIRALREQSIPPVAAFDQVCKGRLCSKDIDDEGKDFVAYYYDTYLDDYDEALGLTGYDEERLPDSWDTYKRIAAVINRSYGQWIGAGRPATPEQSVSPSTPVQHHRLRWVLLGTALGLVVALILAYLITG